MSGCKRRLPHRKGAGSSSCPPGSWMDTEPPAAYTRSGIARRLLRQQQQQEEEQQEQIAATALLRYVRVSDSRALGDGDDRERTQAERHSGMACALFGASGGIAGVSERFNPSDRQFHDEDDQEDEDDEDDQKDETDTDEEAVNFLARLAMRDHYLFGRMLPKDDIVANAGSGGSGGDHDDVSVFANANSGGSGGDHAPDEGVDRFLSIVGAFFYSLSCYVVWSHTSAWLCSWWWCEPAINLQLGISVYGTIYGCFTCIFPDVAPLGMRDKWVIVVTAAVAGWLWKDSRIVIVMVILCYLLYYVLVTYIFIRTALTEIQTPSGAALFDSPADRQSSSSRSRTRGSSRSTGNESNNRINWYGIGTFLTHCLRLAKVVVYTVALLLALLVRYTIDILIWHFEMLGSFLVVQLVWETTYAAFIAGVCVCRRWHRGESNASWPVHRLTDSTIISSKGGGSGSGLGKVCQLCLSNEVDSILLNCGHCIACGHCARRLLYGPCPICRARVFKVSRCYF